MTHYWLIKLPHTWIFVCPQAKGINIASINKINICQLQLKTNVFSKVLFQAYTSHNFKYFLWTLFNPTTSLKWMCVCGPTLFLLLYKRYYEKTGSNLNTKPTEKSPFFISYKRDENYFDHLTFYTSRGTA